MEPLKRFRLMTVRVTLLLTLVAAVVAWRFNPVVAKGLLAGSIAATLVFWIIALRTEKLALAHRDPVKSCGLWWVIFRMGVFGVTLGWAYHLDTYAYSGLISAAIGLFVVRFVAAFFGLTGLDLPPPEPGDQTDGTDR